MHATRLSEVIAGCRREGGGLLAHVHFGTDGLNEREQHVNPGIERAPVAAEPLHHVRLLGLNGSHGCPYHDDGQNDENADSDGRHAPMLPDR